MCTRGAYCRPWTGSRERSDLVYTVLAAPALWPGDWSTAARRSVARARPCRSLTAVHADANRLTSPCAACLVSDCVGPRHDTAQLSRFIFAQELGAQIALVKPNACGEHVWKYVADKLNLTHSKAHRCRTDRSYCRNVTRVSNASGAPRVAPQFVAHTAVMLSLVGVVAVYAALPHGGRSRRHHAHTARVAPRERRLLCGSVVPTRSGIRRQTTVLRSPLTDHELACWCHALTLLTFPRTVP